MATFGCADDGGAAEALSDGTYEVDQGDQPLLESKVVVVTPVKGSSTTATVRAVDEEPKPKPPTVTVSEGPTIVSVTRDSDPLGTAKKGDAKKGAKEEEDDDEDDDEKDDAKKDDAKKDDAKKSSGQVTVKESGGKTIISVPGFPDITLTPDKNSKDGGVIVSVPGRPDFAAPAGSIIEAPGGIKIAT